MHTRTILIATMLLVALPQLFVAGAVTLGIFDINGRLVRMLLDNADAPVGRNTVRRDGSDRNDAPVASGTCFFRLRAGETEIEQKPEVIR